MNGKLPNELQIVIRNQRKGREATPWLDFYRERFAKAAKEAAEEMKGTKLRGSNKVVKFNQLIKEKLKAQAKE